MLAICAKKAHNTAMGKCKCGHEKSSHRVLGGVNVCIEKVWLGLDRGYANCPCQVKVEKMKKSRPPAYRRRTDGNHEEIREALRAAGWDVIDCSGIGRGIFDLLVCKVDKKTLVIEPRWWCEVKRRGEILTIDEQIFMTHAPGPKYIAYDAEGALEFGRKLLEAAK